MSIEEFTSTIIKKLAMANDCMEVEQIIFRSIESMKEKQLGSSVVADYPIRLENDLKNLSPHDFDYLYWCNIRCAILYLMKREQKSN